MMIKTFSEFINESFDSGYGLSMTVIDRKGQKYREKRIFDKYGDIREFMLNWLEKNSGGSIEYFDICSGSNYSDPEYLEEWGGKGGYFYNVLNSGYKGRQQFSYREIQKIEDCEVDINSYLRIR